MKSILLKPTFLGSIAAIFALSACKPSENADKADDAQADATPVAVKVIPIELPPVNPDEPVATDKPVKVYILSGQSNCLGFGRVEGAGPIYSRVFFSADPSAKDCLMPVKGCAIMRMELYQSSNKNSKAGGIANGKPVALGSTAATIPGAAGEVISYLEVPLGGMFEVNVGLDASSYAIAKVDGVEVYRKAEGGEAKLTPVKLQKGKRHKLSITYLTGGSAALWLEKVDLEGMGDLKWVVNKLGDFKSLAMEDGEWAERHDVQLNDAYMGKGETAPLSANAVGPTFGPELGFGWVMGEYHDEPVIVMKADIGNRSLGWDILPPGTESWEHKGKTYPGYGLRLDDNGKPVKPNEGAWYAGKQYDDYTASIHAVLDNFDEKYPQYADQGFEVAGFVWWQGHKDGPNPGYNATYEKNLANLITAWRKEFDAPEASWAIATVGFHGKDMPEHYVQIADAQLAVADAQKHPELAKNVKTIDTRPFWRPAGASPKNQDYHYNHNAETYMLVGDALGRAMVELKGGKAVYPSGEMDPSIDSIPHLPGLNNEEESTMQSAFKPIILNGLIPSYAEEADDVPSYLRGGMPLSNIIANQAPEKKRKSLGNLASQFDRMISYYEIAGVDDYSWKAVDPDALDAEWQYFSFDPKKDPEGRKDEIRYREVELPKGMENWFALDFNPAKAGWKTGKAPFGQNNGELKPLRDNCSVSYCRCNVMPNTKWEEEVLLMRSTMKMPKFDPDHRYRLVVGGAGHTWSGEGYALYIDGELVSEMTSGYYKRGGDPRGLFLFKEEQQKYAGKEVTVALKGFLRMSSHKNREAPPRGHLNAWIEAAELSPILDTVQVEEK